MRKIRIDKKSTRKPFPPREIVPVKCNGCGKKIEIFWAVNKGTKGTEIMKLCDECLPKKIPFSEMKEATICSCHLLDIKKIYEKSGSK